MSDNGHAAQHAVIRRSGYHPEPGHAYEYTSNSHYFWFTGHVRREGTKLVVRINDATPKQFEGNTLEFDKDDLAVITENIRSYFIDGGADEVVFEWRVGK